MVLKKLTGAKGYIKLDGAVWADADFDFKLMRGAATHARSGKHSDVNYPGKLSATITAKNIMRSGAMMGGQITDTATTGAAETLKDHVTLTADGDTAMDDTTIASASRIRVTVETAAVTTAGTLDLVGEDANGNAIFEQLAVGLLGIGEYATSRRQFKKLYRVYNNGIRSATGALIVAAIAGASTYTVTGAPKYYDLEFGGLDEVTGNVHQGLRG